MQGLGRTHLCVGEAGGVFGVCHYFTAAFHRMAVTTQQGIFFLCLLRVCNFTVKFIRVDEAGNNLFFWGAVMLALCGTQVPV